MQACGRPIRSRVEMIVFHHTPRWLVTSKLPLRNARGRIGTAVATMAAEKGPDLTNTPGAARTSEHYHEPVSIRAMADTWALDYPFTGVQDTDVVHADTYVRQPGCG